MNFTNTTKSTNATNSTNSTNSINVGRRSTIHDAGGFRVAERVNDVWRFSIFDLGGKCVAEYGGPPSNDDGGVKYVLSDWQGSTRAIINNAGFLNARTDYTAFGETIGGTQTWKQTFIIDRYGNLEFDADPIKTTMLGSCMTAVCNPDINASDNRFASGQGYLYDANGSVTQDAEGQRFGFDAENHQKEFFSKTNTGTTPDATYQYDGDGRRVKKTSGTEVTIFVYNASGTLVAEYSTAVALEGSNETGWKNLLEWGYEKDWKGLMKQDGKIS